MTSNFIISASVHAGIGLEKLNNLLAGVNIHPISNVLWTKRLDEMAPALEAVAQESISSALQAEKDATM